MTKLYHENHFKHNHHSKTKTHSDNNVNLNVKHERPMQCSFRAKYINDIILNTDLSR